jgi:ubiquinone/menaquinone biosynthesis C-methylase UbiE
MGNYDDFAEDYALGTERLERLTRQRVYAHLPPLAGLRLLDVGCGSGHDVRHYAAQGAVASGIDISLKEIEMAKTLGGGEFTYGQMQTLPYADAEFDIVVSVYAIQHAEDVGSVLREMLRVAKPGATICVLAKHPFRNLLEGHVNDGRSDYFAQREVTSYIFERTIALLERGHTLAEYLAPATLAAARLEAFEEYSDFPASEQVVPELIYPTYMILRLRKNGS